MNDPAVLRTVQYHPISLFFVAIGQPDEAVGLVKRALEVDPGNLESQVMLGNFQLQAGRLDDALRTYTALAAEDLVTCSPAETSSSSPAAERVTNVRRLLAPPPC